MKNQGLKTGIVSVIVLAAGYVLGVFVGLPSSGEGTEGNIGKASRYKKEIASPELQAFEAKLKADEDFRAKTVYSMAFINSRTTEFKDNAEMAAEATAPIPELAEMCSSMKELSSLATNAVKSSGDALEALTNILKGSDEMSYEELSNNAIVSYLLLDRGLSLAQEYVASVDSFLAGKNASDYSYLAFTRDQWISYSTLEAMMNENKEMLAYWSEKDLILSPESNSQLVASMDAERQTRLQKLYASEQSNSVNGDEQLNNTKTTDDMIMNRTELLQSASILDDIQ